MRLSRNMMLAIGLVVVVAAGAVVFLLTKDGSDSGGGDGVDSPVDLAPEEGENAAEAFADGKDELLQMSGSALQLSDLKSGDEEDLAEIPSTEIAAAPGSTWIAYVERTAADKADLHLLDPSAPEDDKVVGPGITPFWNSTGTRLAYFQTDDPSCLDESCAGRVMVVDPEGGEPAQVLDRGQWRIVGWAGDYILVFDDEDTGKTVVASPGGDTGELDFPAAEIKGASPDGSWLVRSGGKATTLVPLENGAAAGDPVKVDVGDEILTSAVFSPDSSQVAAIAQQRVEGTVDLEALVAELKQKVRAGKLTKKEARARYEEAAGGVDVKSHIVLFTPDDPASERFDPSERPREILWSPENDAFVYSALVDPDNELFQSFYCADFKASSDCDLISSWSRGVDLLRIQ